MDNTDDPLWYKDAIIYQLHVRAYCDSNGDGIGDFPGLTSKLDYLKDLGINALWLLPFYPSPLRDDGYDISNYHDIHPDYGTLDDFKYFLEEAHKRHLRIITELVINHTSNQHPWFQAARKAPLGSVEREFYVWSDTVKRYENTRIIFTDSEKSNWAWDEEAKAYYWHRFFAHQPDLNFDNPHVIDAVLHAMRFWFDMGVDGVRLDAIPYLCEREGTDNENLAETHAVIKQLRADLDNRYQDRVFLAEANQWPEDVREYFGDGDECHMAFHFPLMPRIFMAVAQEDRHPITEILDQTPEIPENCQWAVFLRNHDELTLEMVTDRERDYMYDTYATDPRARINLGIRRRLAPLMDGSRSKIELLCSLLLSMPGSPIIYYGDEIGMGDNIYLGDRNGVRTPMQWSPDRNAGFSRADPQRLYLPPIMDPLYGYEAINVEAQCRSANSLLNWMRRLIVTRTGHKAFGRGSMTFLHPGNRKILAYLREYQDECIFCVANLANNAQPVELELAAYKGRVPVELLGRTAFPAIGELPYLLSLPGYGFYWFRLAADVAAPVWHIDKLPREEMPVLVLPESLLAAFITKPAGEVSSVLESKTRQQLEKVILPQFLASQRWYTGAGHRIDQLNLDLHHSWKTADGRSWLPLLINIQFDTDIAQTFFLPLGLLLGETVDQQYHALSPWMLAKVRQRAREGILYDAIGEDAFCQFLLDGIHAATRLPFASSEMVFANISALAELPEALAINRPAVKQSNTVIVYGESLILKIYRRIQAGINPELEIGRFLTEVSPCENVAPFAGSLEYQSGDSTTAIAVLHRYIPNQGTMWDYTQEYLDRCLKSCINEPDQACEPSLHAGYQSQMTSLGTCTAGLHSALAKTTGDSAFDPEAVPFSEFLAQLQPLRTILETGSHPLAPDTVQRLLDVCSRIAGHLAALQSRSRRLVVSRIHGNFHLDQILMAHNDFVITDFEGDPGLPLAARRSKKLPIADAASLCFSLCLAASQAQQRHLAEYAGHGELFAASVRLWLTVSAEAFLGGYCSAIAGCCTHPGEPELTGHLLQLFLMEKLFSEINDMDNDEATLMEASALILLDLIEQTALFSIGDG